MNAAGDRPVELDPADAATILRLLSARRHPSGRDEDLESSIEALLEAIEASKGPAIPDDLSGLLAERPIRVLAVEPRWDLVRPASALARELIGDDARAIHDTDSIGAHVRDVLDELELSLHDPATVYVMLCGATMIVDLLRLKSEGPHDEADEVAHRAGRMTYLSFIAALEPYLPA